mgnify:CR=1 FL=1|jgi:hypothetical protein
MNDRRAALGSQALRPLASTRPDVHNLEEK